jgi:nitronate monooxygenase
MLGNPNLAFDLRQDLSLPVFSGPMFLASTPELVVAQCRGGIVGAIPALNARTTAALDEMLKVIDHALRLEPEHAARKPAPYAVNLVAHSSNDRLQADLDILIKHKVPIVIVSLAAPSGIIESIHAYGGLVFNDVISNRHARKCADADVDGLIAVCAGAGGHTGDLSPFALMQEIREWWDGPLALSGCIATGRAVFAAEVMGADFAYIGSPFLASEEADTSAAFKRTIIESQAKDLVISNCFTGVRASFLRPSIEANGMDPDNLVRPGDMSISIKDGGANAKAWRDIWSAGQGVGAVKRVEPAQSYVARLLAEYDDARADWRQRLAAASYGNNSISFAGG